MWIYIAVFLMIILLNFIINKTGYKQKTKRNLFLCISALVFVLLFGLRDQHMGIDLMADTNPGYLGAFEIISNRTWLSVLRDPVYQNYEAGFVIFNKLVGTIWVNRNFYLLCNALVCIVLVFAVINKHSSNPLMSVLLWMMCGHFLFMFSALRQAIAMAICFYSISKLWENKPFKFLLGIIIASFFHSSAVFLVVLFVPYFIRHSRKVSDIYKIFTLVAFVIIVLFPIPLAKILMAIIGKTYDPSSASQGTGLMSLVYIIIYLFMILTLDNSDKKANMIVNMYGICMLAQAFSSAHALAGRVAVFFEMLMIIILPFILCECKFSDKYPKKVNIREPNYFIENRKQMPRYLYIDGFLGIKIAILGCITILGFYLIATTYWAEANPYIFFFQ